MKSRCSGLTKKGERCRLQASVGQCCKIHSVRETPASDKGDERLVRIITAGTGLIVLVEKALACFPDFYLWVGSGGAVHGNKFVAEFGNILAKVGAGEAPPNWLMSVRYSMHFYIYTWMKKDDPNYPAMKDRFLLEDKKLEMVPQNIIIAIKKSIAELEALCLDDTMESRDWQEI